ncbi:MAG TPA: PIG-L family deacetylase [Bryobacteraceae bacterium]
MLVPSADPPFSPGMKPVSQLLRGPIAIVAAHPDDETVGAGSSISKLDRTVLIHVTDGAPRDMRDAAANGFSTREEYASARRQEFLDALRAGNLLPEETHALGYADQEASLHLAEITRELSRLLARLAVESVLVHPYEGGHPDHDATAFAVHAALTSMPPASRPRLVEFTSYHNCGGQIATGVFLPGTGFSETTVRLSAEDRARKERMLACYRTQQSVLRYFGTEYERFRPAPAYDFTAPPHTGRLFYEQFPWGMTGTRWVSLARAAQEQLSLC